MKKIIILLIAVMMMMGAAPVQAENNNRTATKTEQVYNSVEQAERADNTPTEKRPYKGHIVHRGSRGGLYYWKIASRGKNQGKAIKHYLSKKEKEEYLKQ